MKTSLFCGFALRAKRMGIVCGFLCIFLLFATQLLLAQQANSLAPAPKAWTTNNPFKTDVIIKNYGQFDPWVVSAQPVEYVINSNEKIFFTQRGLVYWLDVIEQEEEVMNKPRQGAKPDNEEEERRSKIKSYYITLEWEGCNPNAMMETTEETEGYYTCGEKGFETLKAKGYKKLTYKNLYPGIDVEYTFPEQKKEGIKYQLILHSGANADLIKMHYTGDVNEINTDAAGNLLINTPAGIITDHAPVSFYKDSKVKVASAFEIKGNTVSFKTINPSDKDLVIDPWTTYPTLLTNNNAVYDIDFDYWGNVYIAGGTAPHKTSKYSNSGVLLWTYTNPLTWGDFGGGEYCYSKFCVLPRTGSIYIGECCNYGLGPRIMKLNTNGLLVFTSANLIGNEEIWVMFYNQCTGQLIGFGGGTYNADNIQIISDTNVVSSIVKNFTPFVMDHNDVAMAKMDENGDFYALISAMNYVGSGNNHLVKSLISNSYDPPPAFDIVTGYMFSEYTNTGLPTLSANEFTVRANALALNASYIYGYDGKTIKAWHKTTGALLGSVIVDATYKTGYMRNHEGIAVDDCNNVYVGGTNIVFIYSFNGTTFTALAPITSNISNEVFDINLDKSVNIINISGLGFVTTVPAPLCPGSGLSVAISNTVSNTSNDSCVNNATATVNNGTPPYSYIWSNGATSNTIIGLSLGTYTITVLDNSCNGLKGIAAIEISSEVCALTIPNIFTPNGDQFNDFFNILYDGFLPYNLIVNNRWGVKMFESNDKNILWNGKSPNNRDASEGVYFYILTIGMKSYHGTVTLIR